MSWSDAASIAFIVVLAAITVSLWTARVALAASGRKLATATIAAVEAVTFVLAFQQIASNLAAIDRVAGYAVGVAAGTLLGLYANERLSTGQSSIQIIVPGRRPGLGSAMHHRGWPATEHEGDGPRGPITTLLLVVDDTHLAVALDDVRQVAPDGFVSVHQLRQVHPTPLPIHLHQAGTRRRTSGSRRGRAVNKRSRHVGSPAHNTKERRTTVHPNECGCFGVGAADPAGGVFDGLDDLLDAQQV